MKKQVKIIMKLDAPDGKAFKKGQTMEVDEDIANIAVERGRADLKK